MLPTQRGSLRLFRVAGITVFLHWSWFVVAAFEISDRTTQYHAVTWNVLEYLALFGIVLLHEFGHSLACRSVGGRADQIVLWPLGGVAYVNPPQRPGATLWSIAAGPLVNVVLLVPLSLLVVWGRTQSWWQPGSDIRMWVVTLWTINLVLLAFNLLPVYPLDGGQILRSLLWFFLGRARSLMVATIIGMIGVAGLIAFAWWAQSIWIGILAVFALFNCWRGWQAARAMARLDQLPRHGGFACPSCKTAPPQGLFWRCNSCGTVFDTFETRATCPKCAAQFPVTRCINCGALNPVSAWAIGWPSATRPVVDA